MHCPHKRAIVVMELNKVKRYMGVFNFSGQNVKYTVSSNVFLVGTHHLHTVILFRIYIFNVQLVGV